MVVREATVQDFDSIWGFMQDIVARGDTYAYSRDMDKQSAYTVWMEQPAKTFVAIENNIILGSYYIKTNTNHIKFVHNSELGPRFSYNIDFIDIVILY
ncbi:hypothetical protein [Thalassotalea sp. PS06]|uniref:hypothetical protein n=1 Tax=Thalassotalea sp. PS06 TaxID=2594005 RepID=UPI00116380D8|nr:hypothetical protein [Thalassotalea sp. PS06]QDP01632.1 hypothetical protein FNC98_09970 [Thalassotalea sp. PS06]